MKNLLRRIASYLRAKKHFIYKFLKKNGFFDEIVRGVVKVIFSLLFSAFSNKQYGKQNPVPELRICLVLQLRMNAGGVPNTCKSNECLNKRYPDLLGVKGAQINTIQF